MTLHPAPEDSGIVFRRGDLPGLPQLRAEIDKAHATALSLSLRAGSLRIEGVELLLAALSGCGIDNAVVELDGPEVPALDGCAASYAFLIGCAGRQRQEARRKAVEIKRPVRLSAPGRYALLRPGPHQRLRLRGDSSGPGRVIEFRPGDDDFARELAPARRAFAPAELDSLRDRGLLRGLDDGRILTLRGGRARSPEGLRFPDEDLRHDLCRTLGLIALLGGPLQGSLLLRGAGLGMALRLLRRLMAEDASHGWLQLPEPAPEPTPAAAQATVDRDAAAPDAAEEAYAAGARKAWRGA
jgi:UDP-3-O-[3-hydroxymyristoyl] N-acetylglucosamine deacetylase